MIREIGEGVVVRCGGLSAGGPGFASPIETRIFCFLIGKEDKVIENEGEEENVVGVMGIDGALGTVRPEFEPGTETSFGLE